MERLPFQDLTALSSRPKVHIIPLLTNVEWNLTFHITLINTHITVTIGIDLSDAEMESKQLAALLAKTQAENRSLKQRISELANRELEISSAEQNKVCYAILVTHILIVLPKN